MVSKDTIRYAKATAEMIDLLLFRHGEDKKTLRFVLWQCGFTKDEVEEMLGSDDDEE